MRIPLMDSVIPGPAKREPGIQKQFQLVSGFQARELRSRPGMTT